MSLVMLGRAGGYARALPWWLVAAAAHLLVLVWLSARGAAVQAPSVLSVGVVEMAWVQVPAPSRQVTAEVHPTESAPPASAKVPESQPIPQVEPQLVAQASAKPVRSDKAKQPIKPRVKPPVKQQAKPQAQTPAQLEVKAEPTPAPAASATSAQASAASAVAAVPVPTGEVGGEQVAPSSFASPLRTPPSPPLVQAPTAAKYLQNPRPDYPRLSRRMREEGTVILRVLVSVAGAAQELSVAQSSGFQRLDQAAVEAVKAWRFVPGTRDGEAQAMWFQVPIVFRMD